MTSLTPGERFIAASVLAGLAWAASAPAVAQQKAAPPDFSSNQVGWVGVGGGGPSFAPVAGRLPPVTNARRPVRESLIVMVAPSSGSVRCG